MRENPTKISNGIVIGEKTRQSVDTDTIVASNAGVCESVVEKETKT